MKRFITEGRRQILLAALLYAILGLLLLVFDISILKTLIRVFGWILLMFAAYNLYVFFIRRATLSTGPLILSIPFLVTGFLFIRNPSSVIGMTSVLIGLVLIFNGIAHIQSSLVLKDYGYGRWTYSLIYSLLITVIGVVLLWNPINTVSTVLKICGALLIIQAASTLISQYQIGKLAKAVDKANGIVDGEYTETRD